MYLLDTNLISELRKARSGKMDPNVHAWAAGISVNQQFLSAITVMELEMGTLQMERKDSRQGEMLRSWLETVILPKFEGRILGIDAAIARRCAALHVPDPSSYRDSLIAATAWVHRLTVVTRDVKHFALADVALINPWIPAI